MRLAIPIAMAKQSGHEPRPRDREDRPLHEPAQRLERTGYERGPWRDDDSPQAGDWYGGTMRTSYRGDASQPAPSYRGHGPTGYQRADARIYEDICDGLTEDPIVDARELVVAVEHGVVTLSGQVVERIMKYRAEAIADAVAGVKEIDNRIRVRRAPVVPNPPAKGGASA